jgi:hypothetical protein
LGGVCLGEQLMLFHVSGLLMILGGVRLATRPNNSAAQKK